MSRIKRYQHSLLSGYVLLGANVLFTLAAVPLALRYLSKPEFGLWALVVQITSYLGLVDLGMSGSIARILIDYKDAPNAGPYGSVIRTGFLVGAVQGLIAVTVGGALAWVLAPVLGVPAGLQPSFRWLFVGQCTVLAASFATRTFTHLVTAHQRYDLTNYPQALGFAVQLGVLWLGFERGAGVFSLLWSSATGTVIAAALPAWFCVRLGLLPKRGGWGPVTWARFRELFVFGRDVFLFSLGGQLVNASQVIVVSRCLGLDAAATWAVCTRVYAVLSQAVWRVLDAAGPALSEMIVRAERDRLVRRFRQVTMLSAALAVAAAILFAATNTPFVEAWTAGKFGSRAWRLAAEELKDFPAFVACLQARQDPVSEFLWRSLSEPTRQSLSQLRPGASPSPELTSQLIQELNAVLAGPCIYAPERFGHVQLPKAVRAQLEASPAPRQAARLNRRLLEAAYGQWLWPKYYWSGATNAVLGLWLVLMTVQRCHCCLLTMMKRMERVKYVYFIEGVAFITAAVLVSRWGGFEAVALSSVVCTALCSFRFGVSQTAAGFGLPWRQVAVQWQVPAMRAGLAVALAAIGVGWATAGLPTLWMLVARAGVLGPVAAAALWRWGLSAELREEILRRLPVGWQSWLRRRSEPASS